MNTELSKYRKSIIIRSLGLGAVVVIILAILGYKPYALGALIGVLVAVLNFSLLSFQVAGMSEKGLRVAFILTFLFRYALLGICIYAIVKTPHVNVFAFLGGFFILQLNIFIAPFINKNQPKAVSQ